jgi:hypothetical protein
MVETQKRCGNEADACQRHEVGREFQGLYDSPHLPGITISTSASDFYPIKAV